MEPFFEIGDEIILFNQYKICFLGYRELQDMAQRVISTLDYPDTTVILKECAIETLDEVVSEAKQEGCQVFVAGAANAEAFKRRFSEHLIELHVDMSDYLFCLWQAKERGARRVAIAIYHKSNRADFGMLQELTGIPIDTIYYESEPELAYCLESTDCDFVIGATLAEEVAHRLGLHSILIYNGEHTIRSSIERARELAAELQSSARKEIITNAILKDGPSGIIITDANGFVTTFNSQAKKLTGFQGQKLRGQSLADLIPPLSYEAFYKSGQIKAEHIHLISGTMVRCIQTQLLQGSIPIGMLVTLQADSSRRKKSVDSGKFLAKSQWKDLIGTSAAITQAMTAGKALAMTDEHIALLGENGTGKSFFAQCIHQGSPHAKAPYIVVNATVIGQDASRTLFGSEEGASPRLGLFELAGNGTIVLQGLGSATETFLACLQQVLVHRSFFSVGGTTLKVFQARIITLLSPEEQSRLPRELREMLSVFSITLPPLRERKEDIPALFHFFTTRENALPRLRGQKELDELLQFYSWPANIVTLSAVCKRYTYLYQQAINPSPSVRQQLLIRAIGEDELLSELRQKYPALKDPSGKSPDEIMEGVTAMKRLLKYNDNTIADKIGLGRTTLWRLSKKADAAKSLPEEDIKPVGSVVEST